LEEKLRACEKEGERGARNLEKKRENYFLARK